MNSTLLRKSITDLTRRKARTVFTVLTLAIAVASVGIFAIPSLMDQAMQKEVQANRLPDLTLNLKPLALTPAQVAELRRLPNVTAAEGRSYFQTRVWVGQRRVKAAIIAAPYLPEPVGRCRLARLGTAACRSERPQQRPERQAGPFLRPGGEHDPDHRRRRPDGYGAGERGRPQHDRRPGRDRLGHGRPLLDASAACATGRRDRLQQPRVPARRQQQGGGRPNRRRCSESTWPATPLSRASRICPRYARPAPTLARNCSTSWPRS